MTYTHKTCYALKIEQKLTLFKATLTTSSFKLETRSSVKIMYKFVFQVIVQLKK